MVLVTLAHDISELVQALKWISLNKPTSMHIKYHQVTSLPNTTLTNEFSLRLGNVDLLLFAARHFSIRNLVSLVLEGHPKGAVVLTRDFLDPLCLLFR